MRPYSYHSGHFRLLQRADVRQQNVDHKGVGSGLAASGLPQQKSDMNLRGFSGLGATRLPERTLQLFQVMLVERETLPAAIAQTIRQISIAIRNRIPILSFKWPSVPCCYYGRYSP